MPEATDNARQPEPGLEEAMVAGRAGAMIGHLIDAPVIVLLTDVDGTKQPFTVSHQSGSSMLPVFTALDKVQEFLHRAPFAPTAPLARTIGGREALSGLQGGAGLVINLGSPPSAEIPGQDIPGILEKAGPAPEQPRSYAVERAAKDARNGTLEQKYLIGELVKARMYVISPDPSEGGLRPFFFENDGKKAVAVFTRLDYAKPFVGEGASALYMPTVELIRGMSDDLALIVDPGLEWVNVVPPDQLALVRGAL